MCMKVTNMCTSLVYFRIENIRSSENYLHLNEKKKKTISNTLKHCSISKGELFGSYLYKIQTFQNFQFQSPTLLAASEKIP